jgi:glyoxylase I family protein
MLVRVALLVPLAAAYQLLGSRASPVQPPRCEPARCDGGVGLQTAESLGEKLSTDGVEYGGIEHVAVLVSDATRARAFYTEVLGMSDDPESASKLDVKGSAVRVGQQPIQLLELPNPDPLEVDPGYDMSAPPPGYVAEGRPVHAGRDRHVAITLHDLGPLKESLEAIGHPYTMSYSGRQALFCRDNDGNGWEFGPPVTYAKATRLFPPYLNAAQPSGGAFLGWGGIPHVGLLVADTPRAKAFYCDLLGMKDETDLRPVKLPFAGLFLRCGEQQVHILELPNPDPNVAVARPASGKDRRTAYSVKSLAPVRAALDSEICRHLFGRKWPFTEGTDGGGEAVLYCKDPDANELMFVERPEITPIAEADDGPRVPWTRLW